MLATSYRAVADLGFAKGGANLVFGIIFAKNCMKMETNGLRGATHSSRHPLPAASPLAAPQPY